MADLDITSTDSEASGLSTRGPLVLVALDGWGIAPLSEGNAFAQAKTPFIDELIAHYPVAVLKPSAGIGLNGHAYQSGYQEVATGFSSYSLGSFFQKHLTLTELDELINPLPIAADEYHILVSVPEDCYETYFAENLIEYLTKLSYTKVGISLHIILENKTMLADERAHNWLMQLKEAIKSIPKTYLVSVATKNVLQKEELPTYLQQVTQYAAEYIPIDGIFGNTMNTQSLYWVKNPRKKFHGIEKQHGVLIFNVSQPRLFHDCAHAFLNAGIQQVTSIIPLDARHEVDSLYREVNHPNHLMPQLQGIYSKISVASTVNRYIPTRYRLFDGVRGVDVTLLNQKESQEQVVTAARWVKHQLNQQPNQLLVLNLGSIAQSLATESFDAVAELIEKIDRALKKIQHYTESKNGTLCIFSTQGGLEEFFSLQAEQLRRRPTSNPVPFIVCHEDLAGRALYTQESALNGDLSLLSVIGELADIPATILGHLGLAHNGSGKNLLN
jgi:hypothetical protein